MSGLIVLMTLLGQNATNTGSCLMTKLEPKQVAVVTGGATGNALAEALVGGGVKVALADRDETALSRAVSQLSGRGPSILGIAVDVSDRCAVRSLRERVLADSRDRFLKRVQPILHAFDAYPQTKGVL
jgi:NAD(P)-dependent dehydrogenase (short-subunit alcohol dehydrogenase family)